MAEKDEALRTLFWEALRFVEEPSQGHSERFTPAEALKVHSLKQRVGPY
jgi:hypothetical protein